MVKKADQKTTSTKTVAKKRTNNKMTGTSAAPQTGAVKKTATRKRVAKTAVAAKPGRRPAAAASKPAAKKSTAKTARKKPTVAVKHTGTKTGKKASPRKATTQKATTKKKTTKVAAKKRVSKPTAKKDASSDSTKAAALHSQQATTYYQALVAIHDSVDDKPRLKQFLLTFVDVFNSGNNATDQRSVKQLLDIATHGTMQHPELAINRRFQLYLRNSAAMTGTIEIVEKDGHQQARVKNQGSFIQAVLNTYLTGFDFDMQLMGYLIGMLQVGIGQTADMVVNDALAPADKLAAFRRLDEAKQFGLLSEGWNEQLMAIEPQDIKIDENAGNYSGMLKTKVRSHGQKITGIEHFAISQSDMLNNLLPHVVYFAQGFYTAMYLFYLFEEDQALYKQAIDLWAKVKVPTHGKSEDKA